MRPRSSKRRRSPFSTIPTSRPECARPSPTPGTWRPSTPFVTLSLGEKIAAAKRCSATLIRIFLFDPDAKVFAALLINARLREEDLLLLAQSVSASAEKLQLLGSDRKWSFRYAIRRALVMNPSTPPATAASQLRFLSRRDLLTIHEHPETSTYLRRCVERLEPAVFAREMERID